jgi:hypothetical protein
MSNEYCADGTGWLPRSFEPAEYLLCRKAGVYKNTPAPAFNEQAVALASAGQDRALHCTRKCWLLSYLRNRGSSKKRLFLHLQVFNFGKDRSDCLCIDRSAEESGEFPAVMDMCDLEAYDQPEAERRDRDE